MDLPVTPPLAPALARLVRELPVGDDFFYEPKWDGLRSLVFRTGDKVVMRSRRDRPFERYFPELVEGFLNLSEDRFALDGEIVYVGEDGFDFDALLSRLHPAASRVERLREETPASFVAFDLIALGDEDLREVPLVERRELLEKVMSSAAPPIMLTRQTDDATVAGDWLERFHGGGVDGVVAKPASLHYEPGVRSMLKVKTERVARCVVAGFRLLISDAVPSSLLLGCYEGDELRHIGIASSFSAHRRVELLAEIRPYITDIAGHPWERGFGPLKSPMGRLRGAAGRWDPDEMEQDWIPLRPELVCEVAYEQVDRGRLRHPARFLSWSHRTDPGECTIDQLEGEPLDLDELLA